MSAQPRPATPAHGAMTISEFECGVSPRLQYRVLRYSKRDGWQFVRSFDHREKAEGFVAAELEQRSQ